MFTHGILTRPKVFLPTEEHIGGEFYMGSNVLSYKEANLSLIFSGADTSHCTTIPLGVPGMPENLKEKKL